jgi:tryptophan synthase alpha chain
MNRITRKFKELKEKNKTAFIAFVTSGDPTMEKCTEYVLAMEKSGADIIEIGIPFSDPLADGPVIQAANIRSFNNDINLEKIFEGVKIIRTKSEIPLLFLIYFNTVFKYGVKDFVLKCDEIGIDGLIIPDLPLEERKEILPYINDNVVLIPLVAPTSKNRTKAIIENCGGFVYCVSSMGVTGTRSTFSDDIEDFILSVKKVSDIPVVIGFGISNKESVRRFSKIADGVIVGSAIVKTIYESGGNIQALKDKVAELSSEC